jgi:hypothetical protein
MKESLHEMIEILEFSLSTDRYQNLICQLTYLRWRSDFPVTKDIKHNPQSSHYDEYCIIHRESTNTVYNRINEKIEMEAETYLQHTKTTTIKHYYNTFKYYTVSQVLMRKENQKGSKKNH